MTVAWNYDFKVKSQLEDYKVISKWADAHTKSNDFTRLKITRYKDSGKYYDRFYLYVHKWTRHDDIEKAMRYRESVVRFIEQNLIHSEFTIVVDAVDDDTILFYDSLYKPRKEG